MEKGDKNFKSNENRWPLGIVVVCNQNAGRALGGSARCRTASGSDRMQALNLLLEVSLHLNCRSQVECSSRWLPVAVL
jgi:hypothetical protein